MITSNCACDFRRRTTKKVPGVPVYLPDTVTVDRPTLRALEAGVRSPDIEELHRRHVILDLPVNYC